MFLPAPFKEDDLNTLHELIRNYNFAVLFSQTNGIPYATHLPFMLDPARGKYGTLIAHMARANPHWKTLNENTEVLVVFQGPHAYISTSWYASEELVPTWNYAAVHAYGTPRLIHEPEALLPIVEELLNYHETPISGEQDLTPHTDVLLPQLKAIVGFEILIERIEGKFKFNQNRSIEDQQGVVDALKNNEDPLIREVSRIMQNNLQKP